MKYFIISLFVINSLFAVSVDIVELYRLKGIKAVENEIARQLKTKGYWDYSLKNKNISHGYYESIQYLMICQKDLKDIKVYDTATKTEFFNSDVFVGKAQGDKKIEGDLKTPIGAYSLTRRITNVDPFYGPLALTTNYPNVYDKSQGKTGHGIWIHGLPTNQERDDFTQGCIALDNTQITTLDKQINIENSVLVISEQELPEVSKHDMSIVLSSIFQWRDAWKYSDITTYLGFYHPNFKKSKTQDLASFSRYKKRLFQRGEKKTIDLYNINVIPYPNDLGKKLYKVSMDENYRTKNYHFNGKKELYLELINNKIFILAES